jgi:hypothetical protein
VSGMLTKILRAALTKPWELAGEGAPHDWEVRIDECPDDPEQTVMAVWSPYSGQWVFFRDVVTLFEEKSLDEVDRHTAGWLRLVQEPEDDDD